MQKSAFRLATVLIAGYLASAQAASLQGHLVKNTEHGQPVADVSVALSSRNAENTSAPASSRADGGFTLNLPDKKVGDEVVLTIQHPDWWVLHEMMLTQSIAPEGSLDVEIILCKIEECDSRALDYFRAKTKLATQVYFAQALAKARSAEQKASLQSARSRALARNDEAAIFWLRMKTSSMSPLMRQAVNLLLRGKLSHAAAMLSDPALQAESKSIESGKDGMQKLRLANLWLMRGKLALIQDDLVQAKSSFSKALQINPEDVWAHLALAETMYLQQAASAEVRQQFEKGIKLARQQKNLDVLAQSLFAMISINVEQKRLSDAIANCEDMLQTYRQLSERNPNAYLPHMIKSYNNLATLKGQVFSQSEVRPYYQQALEISRKQALQNPELYTPLLVSTLYNLAVSYRTEGNMAEASKQYRAALAVFQQQTSGKSDDELRDAAAIYLNLGNINSTQSNFKEARSDYEEALAISRELAKRNPGAALTEVSSALNNLGLLHFNEKRVKESELAYGEALDIRRQLAKANPDVFLPKVAGTLNNLAMLHAGEARWQDARKEFEEALSIRHGLAKKQPAAYLPEVADTLSNLGLLYAIQKLHREARLSWEEALVIYRRLQTTPNPDPRKQANINKALTNSIANVEKMLSQLPAQ